MNTRDARRPPRPTSRRRGRGGPDDIRKGAPLIAVALLLLFGLLGTYTLVASGRVDVNPETGCPTGGPSAIAAILFDRTDPINEKQKISLSNQLATFRESTHKSEEIDAYSLENQTDVLKPLLRICDPGSGTDVSFLTGNPKLLRERWEKQFDTPLQEWMENMSKGGGSATSAIFEAIQSISLQSFQKPMLRADAPRRLIVVSDLLQFTKNLDFYKGIPSYPAFQQTNEARRLHTNLNRVEVRVLFVPRTKLERVDQLIKFWTAWFLEQGAIDVKISWIEG